MTDFNLFYVITLKKSIEYHFKDPRDLIRISNLISEVLDLYPVYPFTLLKL